MHLAGVVGGTVSVVLDAISSGGNMSAQQVAGSFTGGFVTGALISNGVSLPAANAIGAVAGETVTQLGNVAAGGEFSGGKILTSGVAGAIAGKVPELRVPGITSGRGSMSAAFKGQLTKIGNGTTKNPTMKTIKNGVGAGVIGGVGQQAAKVGVNNGVGDSTANAIDEQMGKCLPANPHC